MGSYLRSVICLTTLMILCLMFSPARRMTTGVPSMTAAPSSPPMVKTNLSFEELCAEDPVLMMQQSLAKYQQSVEGYRCTFVKRERINGKMRDREVIACEFQESPFSIKMHWLEGKSAAEAMLYVSGENDNRLIVIPYSTLLKRKLFPVRLSLDDPKVKDAARSPVSQFGIGNVTRKTLNAWQAAKDQQSLMVEYQGVKPIAELNGRNCHVLRRTCKTPEDDGVTHVTIMVDAETRYLVAVNVHGIDGLIAEYYFKDFEMNPPFKNGHFIAKNFK